MWILPRVLTTILFLTIAFAFPNPEKSSAESTSSMSFGRMEMEFPSFAECVKKAREFGKKSASQAIGLEKIDKTQEKYFVQLKRSKPTDKRPGSLECDGGKLMMRGISIGL